MDRGGEMAGKKDQRMTIMVDEDLKNRLAEVAFASDVNASDLVRSCILLSLPSFEATPSLIQIIPTLPTNIHRQVAG